MTVVHRVLSPKPVRSLTDYEQRHSGGTGLRWARAMAPPVLVDLVVDAGLRGRGGAGFPTGRKWRTVAGNSSPGAPPTVVINAAEGEPGTFKDRTILRNNPYHVLEGALIAAHAVGATRIVAALKGAFTTEVSRVKRAADEMRQQGWANDVELSVFEGPDAYLFGEETAMLEAIEGRPPFPRIAPPYRRGLDRAMSDSGLAANARMAGGGSGLDAAPALVDNVETLANVPRIVARGVRWFRTEGTDDSPGTVVCTITGRVARPGVAEILLGTTLAEAIDEVGGGMLPGHCALAALPGVSGGLIPAANFDTPLTYEAMESIGSGLGSASFMVLDDSTDPVAVVAGVARFLAVESCGQCSPCKNDGIALAGLLEQLAASDPPYGALPALRGHVATVTNGARCGLARQQQAVIDSLLQHFESFVTGHAQRSTLPTVPELIAELVALDGDETAVDVRHRRKQPDWTYSTTWSGSTPVELATDHSHLRDMR